MFLEDFEKPSYPNKNDDFFGQVPQIGQDKRPYPSQSRQQSNVGKNRGDDENPEIYEQEQLKEIEN